VHPLAVSGEREPRLSVIVLTKDEAANLPVLLASLAGLAFLLFLFDYAIRLGFLDGKPGLIFHVLQRFWFRFLVDAKIYEIRRKKPAGDQRRRAPRPKGRHRRSKIRAEGENCRRFAPENHPNVQKCRSNDPKTRPQGGFRILTGPNKSAATAEQRERPASLTLLN
jgi:hypothetical protein